MAIRLSWAAGVAEPYWTDPARIASKISPSGDLKGRRGGDWDIARAVPFAQTAKYRAMVQRFVDGACWLETDLFRDTYARRMAKEGQIAGVRTLRELAVDYDKRIGGLYRDMRDNGFRVESESGKRLSLPVFLVGRTGELFIGNQGNHRLAIAKILGMERIAGRIACRHESWTQ